VLTHAALAASADATSARLRVDRAADHWLACLPLAHVGGLSVVTRALLTGTRLTVHQGFSAGAVTAAAAAPGGPNLVSLVATALARLDPSAFRVVVLGGGRPPADGVPANAVITYGLTETGSGVVYDGLPLDGVSFRVDAGGQVLVQGAMLGRAYRTAAGDQPLLDGEGWLATGDGGRVDATGHLTVFGRLAEVIVTGGEKVWPAPVEALLRRHPAVREVAVIGLPDKQWGQRVAALVVLSASRTGEAAPPLEELRALVRRELPAYAAPRQLVVVEALPLTALGKVRRAGLAAMVGSSRTTGADSRP
jgi:O-succinylbenzoic acid--CoA ligase